MCGIVQVMCGTAPVICGPAQIMCGRAKIMFGTAQNMSSTFQTRFDIDGLLQVFYNWGMVLKMNNLFTLSIDHPENLQGVHILVDLFK